MNHGETVNGNAGKNDGSGGYCSGGGYFAQGICGDVYRTSGSFSTKAYIGGQGGNIIAVDLLCLTSGGDGGIAGRGGVITVASTATIEAYNGNRYTDGTNYEEGKNQLEIFAQKGELRDVYKYNFWWDKKENYNSKFFVDLFGDTVCDEIDNIKQPTATGEFQNVLVRKQTTCGTLSYINPKTNTCQGIGSRSWLYRTR